ncbi:MAG: hypothetical protein ACE5JI_02650 [Acidobacteriota bacterium]
MHPNYALHKSGYPEEIWREAEQLWKELSADEKQGLKESSIASYEEQMPEIGTQALLAEFSLFDLSWLGLAGWSAYNMGASGTEE